MKFHLCLLVNKKNALAEKNSHWFWKHFFIRSWWKTWEMSLRSSSSFCFLKWDCCLKPLEDFEPLHPTTQGCLCYQCWGRSAMYHRTIGMVGGKVLNIITQKFAEKYCCLSLCLLHPYLKHKDQQEQRAQFPLQRWVRRHRNHRLIPSGLAPCEVLIPENRFNASLFWFAQMYTRGKAVENHEHHLLAEHCYHLYQSILYYPRNSLEEKIKSKNRGFLTRFPTTMA